MGGDRGVDGVSESTSSLGRESEAQPGVRVKLRGVHSLVWINWCLVNFDRWLKAFPQAVQS